MKSFALVLRGINVGGRRKILMADLRIAFAELGLQNCESYIQSGNVVFQASKDVKTSDLEAEVAKMILTKFGHEVPVIIHTKKALEAIVNENPFSTVADIKDLHCTFLKVSPSLSLVTSFNGLNFAPDQFHTTKSAIYLWCGQKFSDCKMTNTAMERKLGVTCTTRNWKTTLKLLEMVSNLSKKNSLQ